MSPDLPSLIAAVRTNCAIADARHAADMTLCTYLLQMREFHRWERGLPFGAALARDEVGAWIAEREAWWTEIEERDFAPLPLGAGPADPFDLAAINAALEPAGLLYGAGLLGAGRPVFFLAERHSQTEREGVPVHCAGRELARGLLAPPAASSGCGVEGAIVIRRESLARWCWEKFEAFSLRRNAHSAFAAVVEAYALDDGFDAALPRWLDEQVETLVLHELGEQRVARRLGPDWAAMRLALPSRRADLCVRAVRDHLADLEVTLPTLLARGDSASIHFWFANFDGLRELLFPTLKAAYDRWRGGDRGTALQRCAARGRDHFARLAEQCLGLHRELGVGAGAAIESLLTAPEAVCGG